MEMKIYAIGIVLLLLASISIAGGLMPGKTASKQASLYSGTCFIITGNIPNSVIYKFPCAMRDYVKGTVYKERTYQIMGV